MTGTVTRVDLPETTTAPDLTARLGTGREHVLIAAHSNSQRHRFEVSGEWTGGELWNHELAGLDPQALFYNLFACSSARFTEDGYLAGEYVFGTSTGLAAVSSTKVGAMRQFDDYFTPLGAGATFGEAMLHWWGAVADGGFSAYEKDWHYGMTLIGDPLLMTQAYVSEPGLVVVALTGVVLARRRRHARCA